MELPINYDQASSETRKEAREQYRKEQNNKCYYCGEDLDGPIREDLKNYPIDRDLFPPTMFKYPIHLHHDHKTGMTLGAVHSRCNAIMWQYEGE